jgi:LysM repeat protein
MDRSKTTAPVRHSGTALVLGLPLAGLLACGLALGWPAGTASAGTVTVQPGQSLSQVAAEEHTTVGALAAANGITNPNVVDAGTVLQVPGTAAAPVAVPTPAVTTITVQLGQTLSGLAAHYGISTSALAAANGIANPDLVAAGTVLHLPAAGSPAPAGAPATTTFTTVEVQPGQTLSALAARYGTTATALAAANGITNLNLIEAGTVLQLPHPVSAPAATGTPAVATVGTVTVKPGDTLTSLAAHYGTTPGALAAANGITNPNVVFAGLQLKLPAETAVAGGTATGPVATGAYPTALVAIPSRMALEPDFVHAAAASGVPLSLLEALCWWESGWQTTAVSATSALGVCQILPSTAAFVSSSILQVAPLDPRVAADNIDLSAAYLRYLLNATGGNASQALAGYSQGLASIAQQGVLPATKTYVTGILAYASIFAGQG